MDLFNIFTSSSTSLGEPYELLLPIALILILSKVLGIVAQKMRLPQVIGFLVAGILLGLITFIPNQPIFTDYTNDGLNDLAKIGVVLIMFSAGLETDLKKIKSVGVASLVITLLGVIVPLLLGGLTAYLIGNFTDAFPEIERNWYSYIFYGVILSATSVSITVATLKELHQLDSKVGSAIVSAAIIDDIIGIVLLSLVISLKGGDTGTQYVSDAGLNVLIIIALMIAFFAIAFVLGYFIRKLFKWLDKKWPHHRRIPIFGLAICFLFAYAAEAFFNIADITGAYVAGIIMSSTKSKDYIDQKADSSTQLLFAPIFFSSIALKMYTSSSSNSFNTMFLVFGIIWVIVGLLGKVLGAGGGALICRFKMKDSLKIGVGMMARAEVVIVCAQKGIDANLVSNSIMPFVLALIIISSLITPLLLKLLYKDESGI
ncbi:MAG: cation:proton antiporter, partial [Bacilli bacterium]